MSLTARMRPEQADALLRDALEANGQRFTDQRAAVYRYLLGTTEHPTADEVFTSVRADIADISLATVYKALETLVSCNLAVKLSYGDDSARYDARTDDHYHSRCVQCGQVRDVPGQVPEILPHLQVGDGFRVQGYRVEVLGLCPTCCAG
jgi:Fur family peroxide stress response transcriptional regulator